MERTASFEANMATAFAEAEAADAAIRAGLRDVTAAHVRHMSDEREAREAEQQAFLEREEERRYLLRPKLLSDKSIEVAYLGDDLDNDLSMHELVVESILGRKSHRGTTYYKVKWRGRNFVTWELEEQIDNKALISQFERMAAYRESMPRTTRVRPQVYLTRRQIALNPELAARVLAHEVPGDRGVWMCEVEPLVWIPYDDADQNKLEIAYRSGAAEVRVHVASGEYVVSLVRMTQSRSDVVAGVQRRVMRQVQLRPQRERQMMDHMNLDELRLYIASIPEFQPVHYEALLRLHEADKVVIHASKANLSQMLVDTFETVMNQVADGAQFPCFNTECFVCLEDYEGSDELMHLPCGHFFHKRCATDYFERYSNLCPICKEPIS